MTDPSAPPFDPDALIDAAAPLLGLTIDPAHRPGIVRNLAVMAAMAEAMLAAPMDEREEPAAVFRP